MAAELRSAFEHGTLVLTMSNPEHANALVPEMCSAGVEVFSGAGSNPDVHAIVLTGAGADFCSGLAPRRWPLRAQAANGVDVDTIDRLHDWVEAILICPIPVLAAVEGAAAGAGCTLALACDLIVAASNSTFSARDAHAAASPDGGASWFLGRGLPRQLASELLLDGAAVSAERLQPLGLVNRVCEPAESLRSALDWAAALAGSPANKLADAKELLAGAADHGLTQHLAQEREQLLRSLRTASGTTRT